MSASALRSDKLSKYGPYAAHIEYDDGPVPLALEAGDRLGGPLRRRRGRVLGQLIFLGLVGLGGWAAMTHQDTLIAWSGQVASAIAPLLERQGTRVLAASQPLPQEQPSPPPLETRAAAPTPVTPGSVTASLPPPAQSETSVEDASAPVEKLPPAVADPADPYQVRALAAGLHPGLSRAVLARLSPTDYRNAEIAIKTALAETPDTEVFAYPRKRKPELALFQVKFVRGIAPDCRRYVVMVTKDGWLTTAMPMEKCGIRVRQAHR